MFDRLTLRNRIFTFTFALIVITIAAIWIFIRPSYKRAIVDERSKIVAQLQEYSLNKSEIHIRNWLNATNYISEEIARDPEAVSSLLRRSVGLTPGLMRIIIGEAASSDKVVVNKSTLDWVQYPENIKDWTPSTSDPRISISWFSDKEQNLYFFATQRPIQLGNEIFSIVFFFDATDIATELIRLSNVEETYQVGVINHMGSDITLNSEFSFDDETYSTNNLSRQAIQDIDGDSWYIFNSAFETIPFWHSVGIRESDVLQPVTNLIIFSLISGASILLVMLGFSHYISFRINHPIAALIEDVEHMSNLDFDRTIHEPSLPEFGLMRETLENIRITLRRYQKINVEKIIIEEWKNKYMMTYSEDLIGIIDQNRKFRFLNNHFTGFLEILKLNPKEITLEDLFSHKSLHKEEQNNLVHYPDPFTVTVEQADVTYFDEDQDEEPKYYDCQFLTISDENNAEQGALMILHDTTEDRLLEQKRSDMINIIVHELKNPVTGVVGLTKLLMENSVMDESEQQVILREVLNSGERMNQLVNRFLDVQRLESGRVDIDKEPVDLARIVTEVNGISKPLLSSKNLNVKVIAEEADYIVLGSQDLIYDAVQNLVSNAVKYGDENRTIEVKLAKINDKISLSCTDYGYGISLEDQQKVFDKFFRVKSNPKSAKEKGTGLGLAYVKEIMMRHDGDITLSSDPDLGSTFTLVFPSLEIKELEA